MDVDSALSMSGRANDNVRAGSEDPLVSIIIVVFQDCKELGLVLETVLPKKSRNVEIIVIDGGSYDGSAELLRQYDSEIDYWVSEPDDGLYDAMNKGIAAARGRFIYHINAGDRLLCLPMDELLDADADGVDIASFAVSVDGKGRFLPSAGSRLRINNTLHHQGTFYRRSKFPGYNLKYRIFADFDAHQRMARQGARVRLSDTVVALHTNGGVSHQRASTKELYRVVASNYGMAYVPLTWLDGKWKGLKRRLATYGIGS
jgi:glycosyltransferase involved in cell wall biosynthesis